MDTLRGRSAVGAGPRWSRGLLEEAIVNDDQFDQREFDQREVERLLVGAGGPGGGGPCVSIFLPTHPAGMETRQDPVRLRNLLRQAAQQLIGAGTQPAQARDILAPAVALLDDASCWEHQRSGLAIFCAERVFHRYRVPLSLDEQVVVAHVFHITPLLPLLSGDGRFYVLALSSNDVRLWAATRQRMSEVPLPEGTPRSQAEALQYDDRERESQFHTQAPRQGQRRSAVFFGHGGVSDEQKTDPLRYFQLVDKGLQQLLHGQHAPLVVAAVDYLHPIFRAACTYPHLVEEGLVGSPDRVQQDELHDQAWRLVEPGFQAARHAALAQYGGLVGTGRTSTDLAEVLRAAAGGRVEILLVPTGVQRWGTYDSAAGMIELRDRVQPGDQDLLNLAAIQALAHGGEVYAIQPGEVPEVPDDVSLAAVLRY